MEKRVSIRDIAEMHLSQQLERKKALLLNLELDACARQGIPWTPTQGILSLEDRRRYEMKLRERMGLFRMATKNKKSLVITFVTTYGVVGGKHKSIVHSEVTMDDLFQA